MSTSGHLVDDLETSFQNCLSALTNQEHFQAGDQEETRTTVDQCITKFLDVAKQLECFFLQERLLLSIHKPEQIIKEDISELKQELQRKEVLIQRHYDKLLAWQNMLRVQTGGQPPGVTGAPMPQQSPPAGQQQQQPQQQQPQQGVGGPPTMPGVGPHTMSQGPPTMSQGPPMMQQQGMGIPMQTQPSQPPMAQAGPPPASQPMPPPPSQGAYPQGPLAYLEQTTSSIGLPERR